MGIFFYSKYAILNFEVRNLWKFVGFFFKNKKKSKNLYFHNKFLKKIFYSTDIVFLNAKSGNVIKFWPSKLLSYLFYYITNRRKILYVICK